MSRARFLKAIGRRFYLYFMDKTDILWYNTDMNKIVFTGKNPDGEHENKYMEIIFTAEDIHVTPPYCEHRLAGDKFFRVLIEQPLTPLKEFTYFKDYDGKIERAAREAHFLRNFKNTEAILQALGNLIIAYVNYYTYRQEFSPVVEMVREDISKNLSDPAYALDDFIKKLPLNYDYVRKLFQKETGLTPRTYLEWQRMELAASLLSSGISNKYSNYSVSQVAEACGFSEPLYFSRVFKKHFGVAPSEYK